MPILSTKQRYTSATHTNRVGNVIIKTTVLTPSPPGTPQIPPATSQKQPTTRWERSTSTMPTIPTPKASPTPLKRKHNSDTYNNDEAANDRTSEAKRPKQVEPIEDVLIDVEYLGALNRHGSRTAERSATFAGFARDCWQDHRQHLGAITELASQKWEVWDIADFDEEIERIEWLQRLSWMKSDDVHHGKSDHGDDDDDDDDSYVPFEIVQGVARGMQQQQPQRQTLGRVTQPASTRIKKETTPIGTTQTIGGRVKKETKAPVTVPKASPRESEKDEEESESSSEEDAPRPSPKQRKRLALQELVARRKARAAKPVQVMVPLAKSRK